MALTAKLDEANAELVQSQKVSSARALMQPIRADIQRVNAELQVIADSGSFNTVDAEITAALVATWNVLKAAETALEDALIVELLDWRP